MSDTATIEAPKPKPKKIEAEQMRAFIFNLLDQMQERDGNGSRSLHIFITKDEALILRAIDDALRFNIEHRDVIIEAVRKKLDKRRGR